MWDHTKELLVRHWGFSLCMWCDDSVIILRRFVRSLPSTPWISKNIVNMFDNYFYSLRFEWRYCSNNQESHFHRHYPLAPLQRGSSPRTHNILTNAASSPRAVVPLKQADFNCIHLFVSLSLQIQEYKRTSSRCCPVCYVYLGPNGLASHLITFWESRIKRETQIFKENRKCVISSCLALFRTV